jgi:murein DD-endopeptidase MepM/ murein hydrolase activator NlpD
MDILFITRSKGTRARIVLGWFTGVALLVAASSILGAAFYFGYEYGNARTAAVLTHDKRFATERWQREILAARKELDGTKTGIASTLAEVAARVGVLQARMTRLDAIAGRVVTLAGLDESEFNLGEEPALGGPELAGSPDWLHAFESLRSVLADLDAREDQFDALEALLLNRELAEVIYPSVRPVDAGWISSPYGYRIDSSSGEKEFHAGIDMVGRMGAPVRAAASGIVTWAGQRPGYGNMVEINHGNGLVTRYAHNKENLVVVGQKVEKDETIAHVGSTGHSTGPHVHFEVMKDGKTVNPWQYLQVDNE